MIEVECKSVRRVEVRREVKRKREKKMMEEEGEEEQRKMRDEDALLLKIVGKKGRREKMGKEIKYYDDGCTNLLHRPCGLQ